MFLSIALLKAYSLIIIYIKNTFYIIQNSQIQILEMTTIRLTYERLYRLIHFIKDNIKSILDSRIVS